ncbi:MAG: DUF3108 domain-containing protein [Alphaproteobacteria bacterium]|nr:DUF3108 domain-containing protein [Alphaproteobacteria bacterium]MDD9920335.1 DUF3108 domain-containing protein [Alphaproteobacteria bacterium]
MKRMILGLAVALVLYAPGAAWAYNWQTDGERLHYKVSYGFLNIGEAELLYEPKNLVTAQEAGEGYHVVARAWTETALFKLLERLSVTGGHTPEGKFLPAVYQQMQIENDFKANKEVTFNHVTNTASYKNHQNAIPAEEFNVLPQARDMISALYYLRYHVEDVDGQIQDLPVVSLHRKYTMKIKIGETKSIKNRDGKKIFLREIKPLLITQDEEAKIKDSWRIWITADERRLPVKIELKSKFGTFRANLQQAAAANSPSHAPDKLPVTGNFIQ